MNRYVQQVAALALMVCSGQAFGIDYEFDGRYEEDYEVAEERRAQTPPLFGREEFVAPDYHIVSIDIYPSGNAFTSWQNAKDPSSKRMHLVVGAACARPLQNFHEVVWQAFDELCDARKYTKHKYIEQIELTGLAASNLESFEALLRKISTIAKSRKDSGLSPLQLIVYGASKAAFEQMRFDYLRQAGINIVLRDPVSREEPVARPDEDSPGAKRLRSPMSRAAGTRQRT